MINFYRITAFFTLLFNSCLTYAADFEYSWDMFYQNIPVVGPPGINYGTFFQRNSGSTSSSGTGANAASSGNYYIYLETSGGSANDANDTAILETGSIWHNTVNNAGSMSFLYHMYGADIGTLAVEVKTNSYWQRIWEISGQQHSSSTSAWNQVTLNLDIIKSSLGAFNTIRFVAIAKGGYRGDIAIDKVDFVASSGSTLIYKYDELGRLICTLDPNNGDRSFEYDAAGNRDYVTVGACNE